MKLKIINISLFLLIGLCSCGNIDTEYFRKELKGDWKDKYGEYIFSFRDSTCFYLYPYGGEFTKFFFDKDTLYCVANTRDKRRKDLLKFHIIKLAKDTLLLDFSYDRQKIDTIKFTRTKNKLGDEVIIDSLKITTTPGLTDYPSMEISFNRNGNFHFKGSINVSRIGMFKGIINSQQLDFLDEKFRCIDYKMLKPNPISYGCFGATMKMNIYISNKKTNYKKSYKLINIFSYEQPAELRIFANYVMNIYNHIDLERLKNE